MSNIKKLIKKTFLYVVYKGIRNKIAYCYTMRINKKYKKNIMPLYNQEVLVKKISELYTAFHKKDPVTYYIIGQKNSKVGIYGYINCFLPHIAYAVSKGYIPVIDMKNYVNIYQKDKQAYNAWELFYEQPMKIGLDDIPKTGGKIVHCPDTLWYRWAPKSYPLMSDEEIAMWGMLYKTFIRYNKTAKDYIEDEFTGILKQPQKTLGVIYRGTTYTKGHATGHPIQPSMKMLADKAAEIMKKKGLTKIYLASDEKSIVEYMNKRFPSKILINKRMYYDEVDGIDYSDYNTVGTDITGNLFCRDNNNYLIGIEYISSMELISQCNSLVAGACGGTTAVLYMNQLKYEERFIFDLGRYGIDPIPDEALGDEEY